MKKFIAAVIVMLGAAGFIGCESDSIVGDSSSSSDLPDAFQKLDPGVDAYGERNEVIIYSNGIPNHQSPYFGVGHPNYIAPHIGMVVNPNIIQEQNLVFRIPMNPEIADQTTETNLGPIGVATNGVPLFNQYAGRTATGQWIPLDDEIVTFDIYNGHPQRTGMYHYHFEPFYLTQYDSTALIGWALDGFPIYGPYNDDGTLPVLDENNGEFGITEEYPQGIYHYHATDTEPYLVGNFRGKPGIVLQ